jgi:hypothetical protein
MINLKLILLIQLPKLYILHENICTVLEAVYILCRNARILDDSPISFYNRLYECTRIYNSCTNFKYLKLSCIGLIIF